MRFIMKVPLNVNHQLSLEKRVVVASIFLLIKTLQIYLVINE